MAVFKCKMCGGTLEFSPGDRIAVCDSCGSISSYEFIADDLSQIPGWRDADAIAAECRAKAEQMTRRIEEAKNRREAKRLQAEQLEAEQTARRQKRTAIVAAVLCGIVVLLILITLLRGE